MLKLVVQSMETDRQLWRPSKRLTVSHTIFSWVKTKQPSYRKETPLGAFLLGTSLACFQEQAVHRKSYFSSYPGSIHPRCGKPILQTYSGPKEIFQLMIDSNLSGKLGNYSDRLEKSWGHEMKRKKEFACMNDENI